MNYSQIIKKLKSLSSKKNREGMARFGINPEKALGISMPNLRKLAKQTGINHNLALQLWKSDIHEARILASIVDDPNKVTLKQMYAWIKDFNSWDLCDQCCMNLFYLLPFAYKQCFILSKRKPEFEKRTAFALMARFAWAHKDITDKQIEKFFPVIKRESTDNRIYVKKAVNWALRQIGKRNLNLNKKAIKVAKEIQKLGSKSAKWIASDAIRELTSTVVQKRLTKNL